MNQFLTSTDVFDVVNALINSGIYVAQDRTILLMSMNSAFTGGLQISPVPKTQLLLDIGRMNQVGRLANGDIPLEIYLNNASMLVSNLDPAYSVIHKALNQVRLQSSGAPRLDPAQIPETKEVIVHSDDMVSFAFMEAGLRAATGVMKVQVPRFENGKARLSATGESLLYNGTAWLLTKSLIMTNHHVINARSDGEFAAAGADFLLQAGGAKTQMDFDWENQPLILADVTSLEAHDPTLDYAILRIPTANGREPLRRASDLVEKGYPVNIIQHPNGLSKRYAIRNNLVSAVEVNDIRYFTDTDGGSSGSPVLNDRWEVVALHRGATYVSNVQFQGKTTAYINLGTSLPAIINDVKTRFPALSEEINH